MNLEQADMIAVCAVFIRVFSSDLVGRIDLGPLTINRRFQPWCIHCPFPRSDGTIVPPADKLHCNGIVHSSMLTLVARLHRTA